MNPSADFGEIKQNCETKVILRLALFLSIKMPSVFKMDTRMHFALRNNAKCNRTTNCALVVGFLPPTFSLYLALFF